MEKEEGGVSTTELYDGTDTNLPYDKPGFFHNGRACWGGIGKWLFWILVIIVVICIILAIAIPVGLYVIGPSIAQSGVEDSRMTAKNVRVNKWGSEIGSMEKEMRANYGAMFGVLCNETTWATDSDAWMSMPLKDILKCNTLLGLIPTVLPMAILEVPISDLTEKWFGISECSRFSPNLLSLTQDIYISGLPGITNGQILPTFLDVSYNGDKFGRLALPAMNLENKLDDGTRYIKDVECELTITDRHVFLSANLNLFPLEPLVSGQTIWTQQGILVTEMKMLGTTVLYKGVVDNPAVVKDLTYLSGPFASKYPELWQITIDDPHDMIMCIVGDMLPGLVGGMLAPQPTANETDASASRKRRGEESSYWVPNYGMDMRSRHGTSVGSGMSFSARSDIRAKSVTCPADENPEGVLSSLLGMLGLGDSADDTDTAPPVNPMEDFEICNMTKPGDCSFDGMVANPNGKMGYFVYPNNVYGNSTRCAKKQKDGTESPYGFTVQPGTVNRNKVLYYFQGGGACWENVLQDLPIIGGMLDNDALSIYLCSIEASPYNSGLFSDHNTNELNPYYGWTLVQISYCTGDVHSGNAMDEDVNIIGRTLNTHFFRSGYNNTMATNAWIDENIASDAMVVDEMGLGGCSAGALATQMWEPYLAEKYGLTSENSHVVVESYIGIFPEPGEDALKNDYDFTVSMVQDGDKVNCYNHSTKSDMSTVPTTFVGEPIQDDWKVCGLEITMFDQATQSKCDDKTINTEEVFLSNVKKTQLRRAYLNSKADLVQRMFSAFMYALGGAGSSTGTKTDPHGSYETSLQNLLAPLGSHTLVEVENGTDFCSTVTMTDSLCTKMASCFDLNSTVNSATETPTFWHDIGLNGYSKLLGMEVPMVLIGLLQKMGPLGSFEPIMRDMGVDLLNGLSYWLMGDGHTGEGRYWARARSLLVQYRQELGKDASWFITSDAQHCYLPYSNFYEWQVDGVFLHDYLREHVNEKTPDPACVNEGCSLDCPVDPLTTAA
eukprot:CFRG0800T1